MDTLVIIGVVIGVILWQMLREQVRKNEEDYSEMIRKRNEDKLLWEKFGGNRAAMIAAEKEDQERWARWAKEEKTKKEQEIKSKEPVIEA